MTQPPDGPEAGNTRAWLSWVVRERWGGLVRSTVRAGYVNDHADAADVIQEAVLKILAGEVKLSNDHGKAWRRLLATCRNVARNRYRHEDVRRTEALDLLQPSRDQVMDGRERGWRICERLECREALDSALECLTPEQQEVMELRYLEEWTIAEVAAHRRCSPSAVKQLSGKALAKVRAALDDRFGAG